MKVFNYIQKQLKQKGCSDDHGHAIANRENLKSVENAHNEIGLAFILFQTPIQILQEEFLRLKDSSISLSSEDGLEKYLKLDRTDSKIFLEKKKKINIYRALSSFCEQTKNCAQKDKDLTQLLKEFVKINTSILGISNKKCTHNGGIS